MHKLFINKPFGIHHPSADLQKYSSGSVDSFANCPAPDAQGYIYCTHFGSLSNNISFYNVIWSQGAIEGGSSGSPLFTSNGREVIGQLSNSSADCSNPRGDNLYGRFDLTFNNGQLSQWLSPAVTYTVTASVNGTGGTISPSGSLSTASGTTRSFTLTPNANYQVSSVTGSCGGTRNGNTFTTYAISSNCTVIANFTPTTTYYTVMASANTGGSISPSGSLSTASGTTRTFTLTPNANYQVSSVTGSCGGTRNGNTFTTYAISSNCTVVANFSYSPTYYTVTANVIGGGGSISPSGSLSTASGTTRTFTFTPNANYQISSVGGSCGGTLNGNTYITKAITASCTVLVTFVQTYTITASAGAGGTISPSGSIPATSRMNQPFTITPNPGYKINSVRGTCGGTFSGSGGPNYYTYVTQPIDYNCTVIATFSQTAPTYTVTFKTIGAGGVIHPSETVVVPAGVVYHFVIEVYSGYYFSSVNGCDLTYNGIFKGPVALGFTINTNTNCTVTATFGKY